MEAFKRVFNRSSEIGYVSDIIVHPDFRRIGIGSRLVKAAEADLAAMGARRVTFTSNANHGAQAFFKKLGYSIS